MIKISLKGLAKYMTGTSSQQRKVLRDFKNPDPEGFAQTIYYRETREFIAAYHREGHDLNWLQEKATRLFTISSVMTGQTAARLRNNALAVQRYASHFGSKQFEVLDDLRFALQVGNVRVSLHPDLHVRERGTEKLIKLEFTKDTPDPKLIRIMTQAMFEASQEVGLVLPSSAVLYYDVPRGAIHKGARLSARMSQEISDACINIEAIWETL